MTFFPEVQKIKYEGPESKNPLSFRHYNENELVDGKIQKFPSESRTTHCRLDRST